MKTLIASAMTILVIVSCDSSSTKKASEEIPSKDNSRELIGKWVQPIPGQESQLQGFKLKTDNSAESINTNTMKYEKWKLSKDTLFLYGHTKGVAEQSSFTDTLLIKNISDSELVISYKGSSTGDEQTYHKEK